MKTLLRFVGLSLLLLLPAQAEAKLKVIGTLPDFAALAQEIGGERVQAESIILGTEDPHFVDAKPSFILKFNQADLLVVIGLGLEDGWLPVLVNQSRNGKILQGAPGYLDASQVVLVKEIPAKADRSMGDVHGGGNPHYYTSPVELFKVAKAIYARLSELDPAGKSVYDANWTSFAKRYQEKSAAWQAALAGLSGTKVVVYHESWRYLLDWLQFSQVGALEPKPGIPPSPSHVSELLVRTQASHVKFLFQEIYHPTKLSKVFCDKAGAKLLILPSMVGAAPGIASVWDKFDRIVSLITTKG